MNDTMKQFSEKLSEAKKLLGEKKLDLSSDEDLSLAVMNLISIEEHLFFSGSKTGRPEYFDFINDVRAIRKQAMKQLLPDYDGEVWCVSKHLFAASMRLMEVGTKKLQDGKKEDAHRLFDQAYTVYSLFWGLRLKMLGLRSEKKTEKDGAAAEPAHGIADPELADDQKKQAAMKEFVAKLVDCCGE